MAKGSGKIEGANKTPEAEIRREIGKRIVAMRKSRNLSAQSVADVLGISREAITHIENGRNNIHAVALWKLATRFGCDIADLFPVIPDGYGLTKVDKQKIEQEAGARAAQWAEALFAKRPKDKS